MVSDYESWRRWVFDHPVAGEGERPWYFAGGDMAFDPEADVEKALLWITKLFGEANLLPDDFSMAHIGQGLWFLIDPSGSSHMFVLTNPAIPFAKRADGIASIAALYQGLFDPQCSRAKGARKLHSICAVFWSVAPFAPNGNGAAPTEQDQAFLDVLEKIAMLENPVCRKSVLEALDLWKGSYPEKAKAIRAKITG
ncbi:hypothetical protein [Thalassospira australica]|uniref:hypothetical protein n=1 Tax=Thalassospira australica TaxID=1528106 RepID=UPI00384D1DC0